MNAPLPKNVLKQNFQNPYFRWSLIFIGFGCLIRLIRIDMPLLEGAISRQIQTAAITLNLFQNGFDVLHPQIYQLPEPRYFPIEPPIYNFIVAVLYSIFGSHDFLGRLVSIASFAGCAFFIFRIATHNLDETVARVAVFTFSFSPLGIIYTKAFQPDPAALFFLVALFYYAVEWIKNPECRFWPACVLGALAFLTKPTFLVFLLPLLLFGLNLRGMDLLKSPKVYFFILVVIVPPVLWTIHARNISEEFPRFYLTLQFNLSNWFDPSTFLKYTFYKNTFIYLSGLVLTPVGFTFLLLGIFINSKHDGDLLINCWLFGIIVFYGVFHRHIYTHEYYHLPLLPVGSLIIGKVWVRLFEDSNGKGAVFSWSKPLKIILGSVMILIIFGYSNSGFKIPEKLNHFHSEIRVINENTRDEDLMVVSGKYQLYYGRNRGWVLVPGSPLLKKRFHYLMQDQPFSLIGVLEKFRESGAAYYFVSTPDLFLANKEFSEYVFNRFPVVRKIEGVCILFDLKNPLPSRI